MLSQYPTNGRTNEWPNNNRITGQRGTDSMSAVEYGLSWPHWNMGKPATRSGRIASCSRCETTDALMLGLPGGREGKESGAEKRRMEGVMLNEGGRERDRGYDSSSSYCMYYCAQQQDGRASHQDGSLDFWDGSKIDRKIDISIAFRHVEQALA